MNEITLLNIGSTNDILVVFLWIFGLFSVRYIDSGQISIIGNLVSSSRCVVDTKHNLVGCYVIASYQSYQPSSTIFKA